MLSEKAFRQAIRRIRQVAQPSKIIVFGSYARGEATEDSDLDLMIILPGKPDKKAEIIRLRRAIGARVSAWMYLCFLRKKRGGAARCLARCFTGPTRKARYCMKPQLEEAAAMLRLADRDIAALFCHLIEFRRTHDLQRLADLLAEHGVRGPLSTDRLATLSPCAVLLRYDDAEIEVENVNRTELIQMVNTARAWAEGVFLAAVSTEADS